MAEQKTKANDEFFNCFENVEVCSNGGEFARPDKAEYTVIPPLIRYNRMVCNLFKSP
jgi:hypothetical protein